MDSVITYANAQVFDILYKNIESFVNNCEKCPTKLTIISKLPIPTKLKSKLFNIFTSVITIQPDSSTYSLLGKFKTFELSPYAIQAISQHNVGSYVYVDPHLFFVNRVSLNEKSNVFYIESDNCISSKFFSIVEPSNFQVFGKILSIQQLDNKHSRNAFGHIVFNNYKITKQLVKDFVIAKPDDVIRSESDSVFDLSNVLAVDTNSMIGVKFESLNAQLSKLAADSKQFSLVAVLRQIRDAAVNSIRSDEAPVDTIKVYSPKATHNYCNALVSILNEIGLNAIRVPMPEKNDSSLHIILCAQTVPQHCLPKNYIVWQFEQKNSVHWTDYYVKAVLANAHAVWEYSLENVDKYYDVNSNYDFVPALWHESLGRPAHVKDIDYLFYGSLNEKRSSVIQDLIRKKINVKVITNSHDGELADVLSRTKTVINLHYYNEALLEMPRVCESLAYGCRVVSEKSINETILDEYIDIVNENSAQSIIDALNGPAKDLPDFKNSPNLQLKTYVIKALDRLGIIPIELSKKVIFQKPAKNKMRVLVTSASFGSSLNSRWIEQVPSDGLEITINRISEPTDVSRRNAMHPRLRGKVPKMLAWEQHHDYDYYVWLDSSFSIESPRAIEWIVNQCNGFDACFFKHSQRTSIRDELSFMEGLMASGNSYLKQRYDGEPMREQVEHYCSDDSYTDDRLFECGLFVYSKSLVKNRKINLMKEWFYQNCIWSVQDQLSLPYLISKFRVKYKTFDTTIFKNQYFKFAP